LNQFDKAIVKNIINVIL